MSGIYQKTMQSIYIVEKEGGAIKIGISQDAVKRMRALSKQGGFKIMNQFCTNACSNAHDIKREMHIKYQNFRIDGEWFNVSFGDSVKVLKEIFDKKASFVPKLGKAPFPEDIEELFAQKGKEGYS